MTLTVTEDDLLTAIVEAAEFLGWRVHHDRRSDKALQQGHAGFPDLVMARKGIVIFAELKASRQRLGAEQFAWMQALGWMAGENATGLSGLGRVNLRVWWPEDLDRAIEELR